MYWRSLCPSVEQPYSERSGEDYIARRTRMPLVESAVYRYPNAHIMINEERNVCEEQRSMYGNYCRYNFPSGNHHGYCAPEAQKKVHFVECDKTTEVAEEKFDNEDDSFIQRNHKNNMHGNQYKHNFPSRYHHSYPAPQAQKKAHFVEFGKTAEVGRNGKQEVTEEKVDNEADSFIKRKHKSFELAKMDTFKVY
ncbi:hypothetical protein HAX54_053402 [Datura stramonium]|uniref:Uncharacterized protein n=1 Tax=Datura stramonium TaxID=4076 RepID=A0ABS8T116_DATST|nr:hypothetical protein [Datura stramonium]